MLAPMNDLADRRTEEKERRRADILDAAAHIAASVGIEKLKMDDVARRARLSRALLYVYFQDKSDLQFGLCERALQLLHRHFVAASARHRRGLAQVEACGRAYVAYSQKFPAHFEALTRFHASASVPARVGHNESACLVAGDKVHGVMIAAIERGVADGSIRRGAGAPVLLAMTLWGFMHGIIQLSATRVSVLAHNGIESGVLTEKALQLAVRSIACEPN